MQLNSGQQVEALFGVSKCLLSLNVGAGFCFLFPPSWTLDITVGASSTILDCKVSLRLEFKGKDGKVGQHLTTWSSHASYRLPVSRSFQMGVNS